MTKGNVDKELCNERTSHILSKINDVDKKVDMLVTNNNLLMSNHIPHLQVAISENTKTVAVLSQKVLTNENNFKKKDGIIISISLVIITALINFLFSIFR